MLKISTMGPPKRFDNFSLTGGCSEEGLGAFRFFFKKSIRAHLDLLSIPRLWGKNIVGFDNISVQYNGGFLPDIMLLTQGYYQWGTRLNTM